VSFLIRVAIDVPVDRLFDYRCDTEVLPGMRVLLPFGRRRVVGIVTGRLDHSDVPAAQLRHVLAVIDREPLLSAADFRLLEFAARYYLHPLGAVILNSLPAALRRVKTENPAPQGYRLTSAGTALTADGLPLRARARRTLLALLQSREVLGAEELIAHTPSLRDALRHFRKQGWVEAIALPPARTDVTAALTVQEGPVLNDAQQRAVTSITQSLETFSTYLLYGITGSGKTEVYLHAIANALKQGRQALLLVPEIGLTPQLEEMFVSRFSRDMVVTLHSSLTDSQRVERWHAARLGKARIVIGTRLSVFTPMPALGLIVVDEEHDSSFRQSDGFRYSARDLAIVRAQQRGIPVVLGSATPSLESWRHATESHYQLTRLPHRVHAAVPVVQFIDLQRQPHPDGLTAPLLDAIAGTLDRGEQSLVFINRRGFAPVLFCSSCGWLSGCPRCAAKLVLHLREQRLKCHHCGHEKPVPPACPDCGETDLAPLGQGTQRIESVLKRHFPRARLLRVDRDSTRHKDAWQGMREQIQGRAVDILVGTQMLAKGHDFPQVTLVAILNADGMLYSHDFRAAERLFAQLMQVAGRAGRGDTRGTVIVQTQFPTHPLYIALQRQDYEGYAGPLLAEREAAGFPPFVHQALLRAEARTAGAAMRFLSDARQLIGTAPPELTLYDPVPAPMNKRAGHFRAQMLFQSPQRGSLHATLKALREQLESKRSTSVRWALDIDPAEF
jgi:primosomal protein N' (replication factor Y)